MSSLKTLFLSARCSPNAQAKGEIGKRVRRDCPGASNSNRSGKRHPSDPTNRGSCSDPPSRRMMTACSEDRRLMAAARDSIIVECLPRSHAPTHLPSPAATGFRSYYFTAQPFLKAAPPATPATGLGSGWLSILTQRASHPLEGEPYPSSRINSSWPLRGPIVLLRAHDGECYLMHSLNVDASRLRHHTAFRRLVFSMLNLCLYFEYARQSSLR